MVSVKFVINLVAIAVEDHLKINVKYALKGIKRKNKFVLKNVETVIMNILLTKLKI